MNWPDSHHETGIFINIKKSQLLVQFSSYFYIHANSSKITECRVP